MKRFTMITLLAGLGAFAAQAGEPADKFAAMDLDGSGVVTETEFVTWAVGEGHSEGDATAKFTEVAGDDGELTLEELEAAMASYGEDKTADDGMTDKTASEEGY